MRNRRFSLVVSDFHLGAGRLLPDGTPNPLEDFCDDAAFADWIGFYDRLYSGYPGEWVANGDFFETLFHGSRRGAGAELRESDALACVRAIVEGHPGVFDALARFAAGRRRRLVFVTGNHDPVLYFRSVRRFLARRLGGEVRFHRHFHIAGETFVEHGHRFEASFRLRLSDAFRKGEDARLELPWGAQFLTDFVMPLRREHPFLNKLSPMSPYVLALFRRRPLHSLAAVLRFAFFVLSNRLSVDPRRRRKFARTLSILRDADFSIDLVPQARQLLSRSPFRALVLGHTHLALDREVLPGRRYLNTGTWIPMARWQADQLVQTKRLTYVLVHERRADPAAELFEWSSGRPVRAEQAA